LETSKNSRLKVLQSLSALNATIKESEVETTQIQDNILDLDQDDREQESHYSQALRRAHQQLRAQLKACQQAYLLVSPIKGTVILMGNWSLNQNVIEGETVFHDHALRFINAIGKALGPLQVPERLFPVNG
jgi:biotin carboxyl carrier protein